MRREKGGLGKRLAAVAGLAAMLWAGAVSAQPSYLDRPVDVRIKGMLLPLEEEDRGYLVAVKVFVAGQPWLLRVGEVEGMTADERKQAVEHDILLQQVRFYGPDELMERMQKPEIIGKVITIEGRLDAKEKRFLVKALEVAADSNLSSPEDK